MRERRISALALAVVLLATQGSMPAAAQTPGAIPAATLGTLVLTPAESAAPPSSMHLVSHADSLAFQGLSRTVGPRTRVRVFGATGAYQALGSDVALQGIRAAAPDAAGGPGSGLMSWSEIHQVQVRGNAAGQGAKIGGVTMALVGLGLAAIATQIQVGLSPSDDIGPRQFATVTFISAGAGAVVGGMIGALIPKWKTVHSWAGF